MAKAVPLRDMVSDMLRSGVTVVMSIGARVTWVLVQSLWLLYCIQLRLAHLVSDYQVLGKEGRRIAVEDLETRWRRFANELR